MKDFTRFSKFIIYFFLFARGDTDELNRNLCEDNFNIFANRCIREIFYIVWKFIFANQSNLNISREYIFANSLKIVFCYYSDLIFERENNFDILKFQ